MQTTIDIDDDVLNMAERMAAERHQTVSEVISAASRQVLIQDGHVFETGDGIPVIPHSESSRRVTFEMVKQIEQQQLQEDIERYGGSR